MGCDSSFLCLTSGCMVIFGGCSMDGDSRFIINVVCGIILSHSLSVKLFSVDKSPEIKWLLGVYM